MDRGGVLGSDANIDDYVLTECRLNEGSTVGEVVLALFRAHNLTMRATVSALSTTRADDIRRVRLEATTAAWITGILPSVTR